MNETDRQLSLMILVNSLAEPEVQSLIEAEYGAPIFLESKNGQRAVSLAALLDLFKNLGPVLGKIAPLIPLIIGIFTGGFSVPAVMAIVQALLTVFGVAQDRAQEIVQASTAQAQASLAAPPSP